MRKLLLTSTLLASMGASAAVAQDFSITAGATLTSRYVSNGIPFSKGVAFQPYVEVEASGFYGGIWASNVGGAGNPKYEVDLYAGYRNEVGIFSYDLSYARYFYRNPNSYDGEVILRLGLAPAETFSLGAQFKRNYITKDKNYSITANWDVIENISLSATAGRVDSTTSPSSYYIVSSSYSVTDELSASLAFHNNSTTKGLAVLSLSYNFSFQ
jgi:uncharacterized protein (TIGR02001 family)